MTWGSLRRFVLALAIADMCGIAVWVWCHQASRLSEVFYWNQPDSAGEVCPQFDGHGVPTMLAPCEPPTWLPVEYEGWHAGHVFYGFDANGVAYMSTEIAVTSSVVWFRTEYEVTGRKLIILSLKEPQ